MTRKNKLHREKVYVIYEHPSYILVHRLVWAYPATRTLMGVYCYTDLSGWVYTATQTVLDECILLHRLTRMGVYCYTYRSLVCVYTVTQTDIDLYC